MLTAICNLPIAKTDFSVKISFQISKIIHARIQTRTGTISRVELKSCKFPLEEMLEMARETRLSSTTMVFLPETENQLLFLHLRYGFYVIQFIFVHGTFLKGVSRKDSDKNHLKQTTLMTGCYSQNFTGIESKMKDGPYGRVCPLTLDTGYLAVNNDDSEWIKRIGKDWKGEEMRYESGYGFHIRVFNVKV